MRFPQKAALIARVLGILVCAASIVDAGVLWAAGQSVVYPEALYPNAVTALLSLIFAIPAVLILARQPENRLGWMWMAAALVLVTAMGMTAYLAGFQAAPPVTLPIYIIIHIISISWLALIFPPLLMPLLFPTGRLPSPRWRWVIYLAVGMILIFLFWTAFAPVYQPEFASWSWNNPVGFLPKNVDEYLLPPWGVLLAVLTIASLASTVVRFRRAGLVERQQLKWLWYASILFGLLYILTNVVTIQGLFPDLVPLVGVVLFLAIAAIPAAMTIAILRFHLFDVDIVIRLTLVYAVLSVLLGLIYAGGVILLAAILEPLTGQSHSDVAVVLSTLGIAALFQPLRGRVQALINRRFYRRQYDAEQVLAGFASVARGSSDLDVLTGELVTAVQKTFEPSQVQLFIKTSTTHRNRPSIPL
jgi:hypothetical protein